jgi:hypothetical protein
LVNHITIPAIETALIAIQASKNLNELAQDLAISLTIDLSAEFK